MTKPTFKFQFPIVFATVSAHPQHGKLLKRLDKIIDEVNGAIEAGHVIMADSKNIRENINRFVEESYKIIIAERYTHAGQWEKQPEELRFFDYCYEARLIPSHIKKLNKVSAEAKKSEYWGVMKVWCDQLSELADVVAYLKTIEVKAADVRATAKQAREEAQRIKNATDPVYQAVLPLKKMAEDRAEEMFRADVAEGMKSLEAHGFNLEALLPYPEKATTNQVIAVDMARSFYIMICDWDDAKGDNHLKANAEKVEYEVAKVIRNAALEFEAYVAKLNAKIGDKVLKAALTGNPWFGSHLAVDTTTKGSQLWHTQMIVNRSKLGKLFNQFPTRLVK